MAAVAELVVLAGFHPGQLESTTREGVEERRGQMEQDLKKNNKKHLEIWKVKTDGKKRKLKNERMIKKGKE